MYLKFLLKIFRVCIAYLRFLPKSTRYVKCISTLMINEHSLLIVYCTWITFSVSFKKQSFTVHSRIPQQYTLQLVATFYSKIYSTHATVDWEIWEILAHVQVSSQICFILFFSPISGMFVFLVPRFRVCIVFLKMYGTRTRNPKTETKPKSKCLLYCTVGELL